MRELICGTATTHYSKSWQIIILISTTRMLIIAIIECTCHVIKTVYFLEKFVERTQLILYFSLQPKIVIIVL